MSVMRIVGGVQQTRLDASKAFHGDALGMNVVMDLGSIVTFAADVSMATQVSVATEGGSGTPVPDLSVEVDDLLELHRRMQQAGFEIPWGRVTEPLE